MSTMIKTIDLYNANNIKGLTESLANLLSYEEPDQLDQLKVFWNEWLLNRIEGGKITIIAEETTEMGGKEIIGVVRFWQSPYVNNKWLIEGLEVILHKRNQGIGEGMIEHGLRELRRKGVKEVTANIMETNIPSIRLHEKLGFTKSSSGTTNSYGDYREHLNEYNLYL